MRVACKIAKTCILCFFGTVRVPTVHFQKDFDNFDCKPFRPPPFLDPPFRSEPQNIKESMGNRFFDFFKNGPQFFRNCAIHSSLGFLEPFLGEKLKKKN